MIGFKVSWIYIVFFIKEDIRFPYLKLDVAWQSASVNSERVSSSALYGELAIDIIFLDGEVNFSELRLIRFGCFEGLEGVILMKVKVVELLGALVYALQDVHKLYIRDVSVRLRHLKTDIKLSVHYDCLIHFIFREVFENLLTSKVTSFNSVPYFGLVVLTLEELKKRLIIILKASKNELILIRFQLSNCKLLLFQHPCHRKCQVGRIA